MGYWRFCREEQNHLERKPGKLHGGWWNKYDSRWRKSISATIDAILNIGQLKELNQWKLNDKEHDDICFGCKALQKNCL